MTAHYDSTFFDYVEHGARESARVVTARVHGLLPINSVLDVGCGRGIWLAEWSRLGVTEVMGLDGAYVPLESLAVARQCFRAVDVSQPIDLRRRFDLVQSLEVAEHLPATAAETFVSTLTRHGDIVLFSAARPGQGGENHLNERPYDYWRQLFKHRRYDMYDVRPLVAEPRVEPWYRYNTFLFVSGDAAQRLPAVVRVMRLDERGPVPDVAPWLWRARCRVLGALPRPVVNWLAVVKHRISLGWRHAISNK